MMLYDNHQKLVKVYQDEAHRRAARFRLAAEARRARKPVSIRFYHPALAQFGRWLVAFGYRLQRRYGQLQGTANAAESLPSVKAAR